MDLLWASVGAFTPSGTALLMLVAWTVVAGTLAVWDYKRDEGRRFT